MSDENKTQGDSNGNGTKVTLKHLSDDIGKLEATLKDEMKNLRTDLRDSLKQVWDRFDTSTRDCNSRHLQIAGSMSAQDTMINSIQTELREHKVDSKESDRDRKATDREQNLKISEHDIKLAKIGGVAVALLLVIDIIMQVVPKFAK